MIRGEQICHLMFSELPGDMVWCLSLVLEKPKPWLISSVPSFSLLVLQNYIVVASILDDHDDSCLFNSNALV